MDKNRLIMEFGCDARNEAVARVVVAAMLTRTNPTLSEVEDVKTAVSEAVTNSIIHGYGSGEGSIILEAYIEERTLYRMSTGQWSRFTPLSRTEADRAWDFHLWRLSWMS